jgi:hypothetical protein
VRILSHALPVAATLTLVSGAVIAAPPKVDPEQLPQVECSAVHFSQEFLNKYPNGPAACIEARVYKGQTYMKVSGRVYIADQETPTVAFVDAQGKDLGTVTVKDPKTIRVLINGRETSLGSLRKGQKISFWVPESIFGAT